MTKKSSSINRDEEDDNTYQDGKIAKSVELWDNCKKLIKTGKTNELKKKISKNKKVVKWKDENGRTLLHIASECNKTEIVVILIVKFKSEINEVDVVGYTPLHCACLHGKEQNKTNEKRNKKKTKLSIPLQNILKNIQM
jgi:ankyrin repeat protein